MASLTTLGLLVLSCVAVASSQLLQAIVFLQGDSPFVRGNITLSQSDGGPVAIWGRIQGLSPGRHGFHIHEKGDLTGGCGSTGGHYNPLGRRHGAPSDVERHIGDLGNIQAASDGISLISITDNFVSLTGPYSVLGRAVVVHSDADDFGKGGFPDSLTTGHAGSRVACGVIGKLSPVDKWIETSSSSVKQFSFILLPVLSTILWFC